MATRPATTQAGQIEVREVVREGRVIAVLMAIDNGATFTVVTEVFPPDASSLETSRKPYAFSSSEAGMAFFVEALTAFTYLGCDIRHQ
jgi:hypothetical protein